MKKLFWVAGALLFFLSCKDEVIDPPGEGDKDNFYGYFPLVEGSYIIYSVDSIFHDYADDQTNNPDSLIISYHYQVKEVIDSSFIDGEGDVAWRVSRYYRDSTDTAWSFTSLWTAKRTNQSGQRVEENVRFVKLSFPIKLNKTWNGNLFNYLPEEEYTYTSVHTPQDMSGYTFDSCVKVLQLEDFNAIHRLYKEEIYAHEVGLIYRQRDSLNINALGTTTNGYEFRQTLIDYFPK